MIERCRLPGVLTVTLSAIGGKFQLFVVRICSCVVIALVAANAFGGSVRIALRVAFSAIVFDFCVSPFQNVNFVVVERGWLPAGRSCVAFNAVS